MRTLLVTSLSIAALLSVAPTSAATNRASATPLAPPVNARAATPVVRERFETNRIEVNAFDVSRIELRRIDYGSEGLRLQVTVPLLTVKF
jgi:hypothetical protein